MTNIYAKKRSSNTDSHKQVKQLLVKEMTPVGGAAYGHNALQQYVEMLLPLPPGTTLQTLLDAESFNSPIFVIHENRGIVRTYATNNVSSVLRIGDLYFLHTTDTTYQVLFE